MEMIIRKHGKDPRQSLRKMASYENMNNQTDLIGNKLIIMD